MPKVIERVQKVKVFREQSVASSTRKFAVTPTLFRDTNEPESYILVPRHSSERRKYIPMGFFDGSSIAGDTCLLIPNATLYHFGILTSKMHMSWMKYVCGRLEGRFRYSQDIVYNNFPWPSEPNAAQKKKVENAAQKVLDTRLRYPDSSLADLYDPLTMPPDLVKAHNELDKAVDLCYRKQPFDSEATRVAFLFERYEELASPLLKAVEKESRRKKREVKK
jgi:hypothetical protein